MKHYLLYRIFYKPYKTDTLYNILEERLNSYEMSIDPSADKEAILAALDGCNALTTTHVAAFLYFKSLINRKSDDSPAMVSEKELLAELSREKQPEEK